jgi:archaellin
MSGQNELITRFARDLIYYLKSHPDIDLESIDHATPEMDFDLATAHNNKPIHNRSGDRIFITALTGVAYIRTRPDGAKYRLRVGKISLPFNKLYLTNVAQAGKSLSLIVGYGPFVDFATPKEKLKTDVVDVVDKEVAAGATHDFLSLSNQAGYLKEGLVVSSSTDFSVIVNVGGEETLNRTYDQYVDISEVVQDISAFEKTDSDGNPEGKYIVHLKNISFKESITMQVKNNSGSPITFEKLFCKYETS